MSSGITWWSVPASDATLAALATGLTGDDASSVWLAGLLGADLVALDTRVSAAPSHRLTGGHSATPLRKPSVGLMIADVRWTAANGDVLRAKSTFQKWTGTPGKSTAIDTFIFENGGTGRFQFARGEGTGFVDTQRRVAGNDGVLRYGRTEK